MADFNNFEKKMEEERQKEETKYEEQNLVTSHPPLSPHEPHTWFLIIDGKNGSERHMFYGITEDHNYVRYVQELQNKKVSCCYGGWLILRDKRSDKYMDDYSMLNILTMEKLQLPPLAYTKLLTDFVMSSPIMDRSCRVIFIERKLYTFWSWQLGNKKFIEQELTYKDEIISDHINYKGKLYAVTTPNLNLIAFDFSDPDFHHEHIISGEKLLITDCEMKIYLVESCEDILLICIGSYSYGVSDVQVFKADLSTGEWVELKTLGDRTIFLGSRNNNFSSPDTTALGMKGNAIYWVSTPFRSPYKRLLYMYDIEDKSISMSAMFPIVGTSLFWWESFPMSMTFINEDKKSEQKDRVSLVIRNFFRVRSGEATIKSTRRLQIDQMKIQKKAEEKMTIGSTTMVRKESLWSDLPIDLLLEIFRHLFAGEIVGFHSVCRSWYLASPPPPSKTTQKFVPLKSLDFSIPLLMFPYSKAYDPIHRKLYSIDFPDIPGAKVRATRDGWLLMDYYSTELYFYNPFTKEHIFLPSCDAMFYYSVFFSAPPTSADCLVVVAANTLGNDNVIFFKKFEDEGWTSSGILSFCFSDCNLVVYKGLYYFFGVHVGLLLIFDPKKNEFQRIEAPKFISELKTQCEQQYMLESDEGKLIAVFVGPVGSFVYTCEWNVSTSKWEILRSLGNNMLFVSRPLSLCKRATVRGAGNKIYFPRVVCDGHILFYSLATRRYHTFEMGSSYSNFSASKFYPEYNSWFMS